MNERRWSLCEAGRLREAVIPGCHPMAHERGRSACSSTCVFAYLAYTGKWETCQGIGIRCETIKLAQRPLTALSSATPHPRVGPRHCSLGAGAGLEPATSAQPSPAQRDCAAAPPHAWLRRPPSRAHLARRFRLGVGEASEVPPLRAAAGGEEERRHGGGALRVGGLGCWGGGHRHWGCSREVTLCAEADGCPCSLFWSL